MVAEMMIASKLYYASDTMTVNWINVSDSNPTDRKHRVVLFDDDGVRWCDWKVYDVKRGIWLNCEIQPRYWLEGLALPKKDDYEF